MRLPRSGTYVTNTGGLCPAGHNKRRVFSCLFQDVP
jgi:hypothetical protein